MSMTGDHNYKLKLRVTDRDFAQAFADAIGIVLKRAAPRVRAHAKTNAWHVDVSSLLLQQFLRRPLDELRPTIEHCDECSGAFLRGFFDSEGNVFEGSVTAANTDKPLIELVLTELLRLGIQTTGPHLKSKGGRWVIIKGKTYRANHDCFTIRIRNSSRRDFLEKVGFKIRRKNDALAQALDARMEAQR
jgi:intein-encoded DNA endonuclease-like protein